MRRRWKVLIGLAVALAVALTLNTVVVNEETKPAGKTVFGGRILHLGGGDVQVLEQTPFTIERASTRRRRGRPIVLLHCYGCSLRWWDRVAPILAESRPVVHRVLRFDLLGHGGSEKPDRDYSMEEQASIVAEGLNRLGVSRAVVVGHSMGGLVATALAEQSPRLVDRVVVIGTAVEPESGDLPLVAQVTYAPVIGQALWRVRLDSLVREGYEAAFAPGFDMAEGFDDPDQVVVDNDAMTYSSYDRAQSEFDEFLEQEALGDRIARIGVPLLAIYGPEDEIVEVDRTTEALGDVSGAQIETIDGTGHSPQVEKPGPTARLILGFGRPGVSIAR